MLATVPGQRERPVLAAVLWVVSLVALCFVFGHLSIVLERVFAWPDPAPGCPYPFCGNWVPR